MKDTIQRLRYICLQNMGKDPFSDTTRLPPSERTRLFKAIQEKLDSMKPEEIEEEFNSFVHEKVLHNGADLDRFRIFL